MARNKSVVNNKKKYLNKKHLLVFYVCFILFVQSFFILITMTTVAGTSMFQNTSLVMVGAITMIMIISYRTVCSFEILIRFVVCWLLPRDGECDEQ